MDSDPDCDVLEGVTDGVLDEDKSGITDGAAVDNTDGITDGAAVDNTSCQTPNPGYGAMVAVAEELVKQLSPNDVRRICGMFRCETNGAVGMLVAIMSEDGQPSIAGDLMRMLQMCGRKCGVTPDALDDIVTAAHDLMVKLGPRDP